MVQELFRPSNTINTRSSMLPIICGVPQSSISGPLLFIVYNNDIIYMSEIADIILFADDTKIFLAILTKIHCWYWLALNC